MIEKLKYYIALLQYNIAFKIAKYKQDKFYEAHRLDGGTTSRVYWNGVEYLPTPSNDEIHRREIRNRAVAILTHPLPSRPLSTDTVGNTYSWTQIPGGTSYSAIVGKVTSTFTKR